jgi:hypothetical protein
MDIDDDTASAAPLSIEQAFLAFTQQMAQSNAINQQTIQGLQNILQQIANAPQQERKKEKLPQLSEFDGTRSKYDGWELEARNKIKTDGVAIGPEMDQLRYIFARLRGNARSMCLAFMRTKEKDNNGSGVQLLEYLAATYSDANRQKKALSNIYSIKQKANEPFAKFLPRFKTELANAGALSFDNSIKISLLENAVNRGMQERLVSVFPVPTEYGAFTSLLQTIGLRIDAFQEPRKGYTQRYVTQASDNMDWELTSTIRTNRTATESNGRRATWVSQETINYRREKNLCLRCGNQGYMVKDCKFLRPQRPLAMNRASTDKQAKADPLPEQGESDNESEKE